MPEYGKVILICLGVVVLLGLIVSMTLRHHIGGFLSTIEREEEEARLRDEEDALKAAGQTETEENAPQAQQDAPADSDGTRNDI